jgi:hypothetical protein
MRFPENLRSERTTYRDLDIFTMEGFRSLRADRDDALEPLFVRAMASRRRRVGAWSARSNSPQGAAAQPS